MMLKQTHTFSINHSSEIDQKEYAGQFTCNRLTVMARSRISIKKSQLCGGMYCVRDEDNKPTGLGIDEETEGLNYMLASLEVLLIQKPEWFKPEEISDEAVIIKVFREVMAFDNSFRVGRGTTAQENGPVGSGEGTGAKKSQEANLAGAPKKVVDPEIQAALDA